MNPTTARAEAGFTKLVVGNQGREARDRLFTVTAKLVLGRGKDHISDAERVDFWDRVSFANYIQSFVTETAADRTRPSEEMWEAASEPFLQTAAEVRPDGILVLGRGLGCRIPEVPNGALICAIRHPSHHLKYAEWQPRVQKFIADLRARRN